MQIKNTALRSDKWFQIFIDLNHWVPLVYQTGRRKCLEWAVNMFHTFIKHETIFLPVLQEFKLPTDKGLQAFSVKDGNATTTVSLPSSEEEYGEFH